jgi:uncharacterized protein (DUF1015 family)
VTNDPMLSHGGGLSLAPFRAVRFADGGPNAGSEAGIEAGKHLCPPYDVISDRDRAELVRASSENTVRLILPGSNEAELGGGDRYAGAAELLRRWVADETLTVDPEPALFVYEMHTGDGEVTRGLLGAVELRDPEDGVILPHENTMAGPVSDRLALMTATEANLEPIYLVYDGGGRASEVVAAASDQAPVFEAVTPDGIQHRLWSITDNATHAEVAADLATRRALIADGHHRYATYRQLQADRAGQPGPWDRGLTLLVDTSSYGPQVHPIHRVIPGIAWQELVRRAKEAATVSEPIALGEVTDALAAVDGFAVALANSAHAVIISDISPETVRRGLGADADTALGRLDVTILHRVLVEQIWGLPDTVDAVGYAHDVAEALSEAERSGGAAVIVRATPVQAVAEVAAAGARMPRKSTLFTPKPASGVVFRRFADQTT